MTLEGPVEIEFKLRANSPLEIAAVDAHLREVGYACRAATGDEHVDIYLDDDRRTLQGAGIGLRLRRSRAAATLTAKLRGSVHGALHQRTELQCDWTAQAHPATAAELPAPLRASLAPLLDERPLRETLRLVVQRERRVLQHQSQDLCEVAIDRVTASNGARSAAFDEVEIEVLDDTPRCSQLCDVLARRLRLQPAEQDKPTHAAQLLGMPTPRAAAIAEIEPVGSAEPIAPLERVESIDDTVSNVADAALRRHLSAFRAAGSLLAAQTADDAAHAEGLHAMRVALRRLRTIAASLPELWTKDAAAAIRARLRTIGRRLGEARDLDVLLVRVTPTAAALPPELRAAGQEALLWLQRERDRARLRLRAWLASPEYAAELDSLQTELTQAQSSAELASTTFAAAVQPRFATFARRFRRRLRRLPAHAPLAELHTARLACKRLRYLAEVGVESDVEVAAPALQRALAQLQRRLGDLCDHFVTSERLELAASRLPSQTPRANITALAHMAQRHRKAAERLRAKTAKSWQRLAQKKAWR